MKKNLEKLYNLFTGPERMQLVIEARARGDEGELDKLVRSCPREHFSILEDAYTVPLKATVALVTATCHDFALPKGRLEALDVVTLILSGLIEDFSKLETISPKSREDIMGTLKALLLFQIVPLRVTILAEIKGQYEAFKSFFRSKLDLHPEALLKAFDPTYWEWIESLKEEISIVEIDPEWVDYEIKLENAWNLIYGRV